MKQSKYTGKITARYLPLIFLQILRQLHCTCYMVTQLTNTQKSFFAPRLRGSIKQQKRIINYWILMLFLFFYSPKPRARVWILKKTDLFGKETQTTAGTYGWAGARGTWHTTEPQSLHFRPQSHSASRPRDRKKRRDLGARMRSLLVSVVCASLPNFYL